MIVGAIVEEDEEVEGAAEVTRGLLFVTGAEEEEDGTDDEEEEADDEAGIDGCDSCCCCCLEAFDAETGGRSSQTERSCTLSRASQGLGFLRFTVANLAEDLLLLLLLF